MSGSPLISVVIPAYNSAASIAEAIESVTAQTYENWEIVVVNDGSTDGTGAIVRGLGLPADRLRYIEQANAGEGLARNRGVELATGELIAFQDSDDWWEPTKLEEQVAILAAHQPDVIFTNGYILGDATRAPLCETSGYYAADEMFALLYQYCPIFAMSVVTTKAALAQAGHFRESGLLSRACEDYDLWLRMAHTGSSFYCMPEQLVGYRVLAKSPQHKLDVRLTAELAALNQFEDTVRYGDPQAYHKRLSRLYNRLAAAHARAGSMSDARDALAELRHFEGAIRVGLKRAALALLGRRYDALYRLVANRG